jgi:hypothetical protein
MNTNLNPNTSIKPIKIIRQKLVPIHNNKSKESETLEKKSGGTRFISISDDDMPLRIQHKIRNMLPLEEEELEYIAEMNCKNMFEIVQLLNKLVEIFVENIMTMT